MRETIKLTKNKLEGGFKRLGLTFFLTFFSGFFAVLLAQNISVSGTVKDEQGSPIPGVNVVEVGLNKGVLTDIDGNFIISILPKNKLQFSFIGYESQTITPKEGKQIEIVLTPQLNDLDEVVVLGPYSQKIKHSTYAAQNVKLNNIDDLPATNLGAMLRDQIPGVSVSGGDGRPGESASITIRQSFSLSKDGGNSNPLVVIDDVPQVDINTGLATLGAFNSLNIDEVESITVLKDGAAAIYGSRASQGAIVVKTKRGKKGAPKISYSGKYVTNNAVSHSKTLNTYEYGLYANSFLRARGVTSASSLFSDDELEQMKDLNYDWLSDTWHSSQTYQHSLSVSGGSDNVNYYTSASYVTQGPNMGSEEYGRWNFRSSIDAMVAKNLKLSVTISANKSDNDKLYTKVLSSLNDGSYGSKVNGMVDYSYLHHIPGYIPKQTDIDGTDYWVSPALGPQYVSSNVNGNRTIGAWNYNAIAESGSRSISSGGSYDVNFALEYEIPFVKGLSVKGTYARSFDNSMNEQIQTPYSLAIASNTNQQDNHLYGENTKWSVGEVTVGSRVVYGDNQSNSYHANAYVNYNRRFGQHIISGVASISRSESSGRESRQIYDNPLKPYQGTNATAGIMDPSNSYVYRYESGTMSYLARVSYVYADKYLAQFLIRSDASTKFAPENYWGTFPSGSFGWVPSLEDWFKDNIKFVDFMKIRYSVGLTGKDNLKGWKWMQTYSWDGNKGYQFGVNGGQYSNSLKAGASPNRNATWDKCLKQDWGLDMSLLDGRLGIGYDYFFNKNYDMLKSRSQEIGTPISVGGAVAEENFAAINDWGNEVSLSWHDRINKFRYNVGVNFTVGYGNKVIKYIESGNKYPAENTMREGVSTIFPDWGFKVWKGTSTGDGMLRTQDDIDNYWAYLTANAEAAGSTPKYFSTTDPSKLKLGMLAYQDLGGDLNEDGTQDGPNGQIVKNQDFGKLVKRAIGQGFSTSLGCSWKSIDFRMSINTGWGNLRMIDRVSQQSKKDLMLWNRESFWRDTFDAGVTATDENGESVVKYANLSGKYPNVGLDNVLETSDFWQLPGFRCHVSNMTIGYVIPREYLSRLHISSARLSLTGTNLWDLYNPYPDKYRNMYDSSFTDFPTLRSWSMGVNISF